MRNKRTMRIVIEKCSRGTLFIESQSQFLTKSCVLLLDYHLKINHYLHVRLIKCGDDHT
jgi:hypothetical protein